MTKSLTNKRIILSFMGIKMISLAIFIVGHVLLNNVKISDAMIWPLLIWLLFFLFTFINASINEFRFDTSLFEIYIIRPVVFVLLAPVIDKEDDLHRMTHILIILTLFIGIYNFIIFMQAIGLIPKVLDEEMLFGTKPITIVTNNFFTYRSSNQTALMFLMPFILIIGAGKEYFTSGYRKMISICVPLIFMVCLTSGRRILQIEALLAIAAHMVLRPWNRIKTVKRKYIIMFMVAILGGIIMLYFLNTALNFNLYRASWMTLKDAFGSSLGKNSNRGFQIQELLRMWKEKPIIGWGISAYSSRYNEWRSAGRGENWSYEFFYLALLFQIGLIGICFLGIYVYRIFRRLYKFSQVYSKHIDGIMVKAILWGYIGFLFCGASNPLVTSSWMWFIVIACVNYCKQQNNGKLHLMDL